MVSAQRPARLVSSVAGAIGLCILGDSLLYSILPLEAARVGMPLSLVGVLLSANRLVRLATNSGASILFERWGPYASFLLACGVGLCSTMLYGVSRNFLLLLAARMIWGAAWSALRQGGYQAVWSGAPEHKGRLTGLLWGIIRLGSAVSVLLGGVLYDRVGFTMTLVVISCITALAIPVAYLLRWPPAAVGVAKHVAASPAVGERVWRRWRQLLVEALAPPVQRWLTIAGGLQLLSSSVVIATSSLLLAGVAGSQDAINWLGVATVTGLLQGARWLSDITVGPAFGYVSDRLGQANTAALLVAVSLLSMAGLAFLPAAAAIYCLLFVLLCDSGLTVTLNAAATGIAVHTARPHRFIGVFTTVTDLGSALGPLFALSVGQAIGFSTLYLVVGAACLTAIWRYRWLAHTRRRA